MFTNFDEEIEQTLLKVLQNLADITAEAKKIQEQEQKQEPEKQKCNCADENENEEENEEFNYKMAWLEECRHAFLEDFVDWIAALPYLPDKMVDDINSNHVQIVRQLNKCFEEQIEPAIALMMLTKKSSNEEFCLADILKIFNFTVKKVSKETKDEVSSKEKELLNALKSSPLYRERKK